MESSSEHMNLLLILFVMFQQAGLHPTAEQIELFAYHLPKATLSNLIVSCSTNIGALFN